MRGPVRRLDSAPRAAPQPRAPTVSPAQPLVPHPARASVPPDRESPAAPITLDDAVAALPESEVTLRRRLAKGPVIHLVAGHAVDVHNDVGQPGEYRLVVADRTLGVAVYRNGRRSAGYVAPAARAAEPRPCGNCGVAVRGADYCELCDITLSELGVAPCACGRFSNHAHCDGCRCAGCEG